ncbi:MAG: fibronectin type III domain-containing protein [Methylococcaceae bacterium]|nr:fibronectin type III domain-containing protein [Methylococcaceae bacterium]
MNTKTNRNHKKPVNMLILTGSILSLLAAPWVANAETANGIMTVDINAAMLAGLGNTVSPSRYLYLEDFINETYNNAPITSTGAVPSLILTPNPTALYNEVPALGLKFPVNSATIAPSTATSTIPPFNIVRILQATTLNYTGSPTSGTGKVGFSGALRLKSDVFTGWLKMPEWSLYYDAARVNIGGFGESGWIIKANEAGSPDGFGPHTIFALKNVTTSSVNGALNLSGDLIFGIEDWGSSLFFNLSAIDAAKIIGHVNLVPVPAAPSGLSGTVASTTQINLAWADNATGEASQSIERCSYIIPAAACTTFTALTPAIGSNVVVKNNTGLTNGTTYRYRIRAQGASGYSAYSNTVTITAGLPAAPSGLASSASASPSPSTAANGLVNLIWADNANNETKYKLERCKLVGATCTYAVISAVIPANTTSFSNTGLLAGTYKYRVTATNTPGSSPVSNIYQITI